MKIKKLVFLFLCLFVFALTSCEGFGGGETAEKTGTVVLENDGIFEGGKVELSAVGELAVGTIVNINAMPDEGYLLDEILINGKVSLIDRFAVTEGETTVSATFKEVTYGDVSITCGPNGRANLSESGPVVVGTRFEIEYIPEDGY